MNAQDLNLAWQAVEAPTTTGALAGRLAPDLPRQLGITIAVDHAGLRHVLIPVASNTTPPKRPVTKGLEVDVEELKVGTQPPRHYLDVACRDATMHENFSAVAAELLTAPEADHSDPTKTVGRILARWRWFWGAPPGGLTEEAAIGLFGELWFLEFWLRPVNERVLATWTGAPGRDRHDFKWPAASVEVKATRARGDGAAEHRISGLDQLEDPEQGTLHLFSLRVTPDPIGAHSLVSSIDRIRKQLGDDADVLRQFDQLLGQAGYSPAHRDRYSTLLRVVAEELYVVRDAFPRLTKQSFAHGIPPGVDKITYTLDLAACHSWRVADRPTEYAARKLRDTIGH